MANDVERLIQRGMGMRVLPEIGEFDYDYWNGRMLCYEPPISGEQYIMGIDPAEGVSADRSVCQVIKYGNMQHPDVQVAEFACDFLDPVDFANVVATMGRFYSSNGEEAFATVEINAPSGNAILTELRNRLEYDNLYIWKAYDRINNVYTNKYGWWTNRTTRPALVARGLHSFANGDLVVNSPFLLDEMADFERDHFIAKAKARHGKHDDRIMALLIGYYGGHDDEWLSGDDIGEERRLRGQAREIQEESKPTAHRVDYQNSAITTSQMNDRINAQFEGDW